MLRQGPALQQCLKDILLNCIPFFVFYHLTYRTGGRGDPEMLSAVARLGVPMILMHMRGTPQTMTSPELCTYGPDVVAEVAAEITEQLAAADRAGIPR